METRTVPHAGWDGKHRGLHQTSHHARERPFHPRNHHHSGRLQQLRMVAQQAMESGHAHVVDDIDLGPHDLGGDAGLFRHGDVAGSRRDDRDPPPQLRRRLLHDRNRACAFVVFRRRMLPFHRLKYLPGRARRQDVSPGAHQRPHDADDLFRGLPRAKHRLRKTAPKRPVMVHLRKTHVLEREELECLQDVVLGELSLAQSAQELA